MRGLEALVEEGEKPRKAERGEVSGSHSLGPVPEESSKDSYGTNAGDLADKKKNIPNKTVGR